MHAVLSTQYGDETSLHIGHADAPIVGPDQILVKVRAAGLNPVDWKTLRGDARAFSGWRRPPQILGADFAGTVQQVGANVSTYQPGDKVFGMVPAFKGGAFAQLIAVSPENIAPMPKNLSFVEAASVPLVALTAHQFLFQKAQIQPHHHVLINGSCGGLGHMAVLLAKACGASVTGVCSTRNIKLAKQLGCDFVIDYTQADPIKGDIQYDGILDTASTMTFAKARKALRPNGVFSTALPSPQNLLMAPLLNRFRKQKEHALWVRPDSAALAHISSLLAQHNIHPHIEKAYPFTEIAKAIRHSKTGKVSGKLVLDFTATP
jgi:NADPH:quinone reductase-like Zn-dependent oxidoreductase